jgi:hypothetical protein
MRKTNPVNCVIGIALLCAGLTLGGCASIFHSGNREITINTEPTGAKASISKLAGDVVNVQTTPCTVSLNPRRGYFKGQSYLLKLELLGYKTAEITLRPTLSGWYFANIIIGGAIGMVAVDPATGAMWNLAPDKIEQKLSADQASLIKNRNGFIVVLASELTDNERKRMVRIN